MNPTTVAILAGIWGAAAYFLGYVLGFRAGRSEQK